jgi:tetratricopeptide (TPR) repeat protein
MSSSLNLSHSVGWFDPHARLELQADRQNAPRGAGNRPTTVLDVARERLDQGDALTAERIYREAVAEQPQWVAAWSGLGAALTALNRGLEARSCFEQAIALEPGEAVHWAHLGELFRRHRLLQDALRCGGRAVELDVSSSIAHLNLGWAQLDSGQHTEALASFNRVIAAAPQDASGHFGRARSLLALKRWDEAHATLRQCEQGLPTHPDIQLALAQTERLLGRPQDTLKRLQRLFAQAGQHPSLLALQFDALIESGQAGPAHALIDQLASTAAGSGAGLPAGLMYRWSLSLLERGDYARGFQAYEHRLSLSDDDVSNRIRLPWLPMPLWRGEDLRGRKLLVLTEQGFGDHIQFCRFISVLADAGVKVTMAVSDPLRDLMSTLPGVTQVVTRIEDARSSGCDDWVPIGSLPHRVLPMTQGHLWLHANGHYLQADANRRNRWRETLDRLDDSTPSSRRLRVGLVWSGRAENDYERRRSPDFRVFEPWAALPGIHWLGLQTGARAGDPQRCASPLAIQVFNDGELGSFADTAALIQELDIFICIDTAYAHLAGALGQEVWLMLPQAADWRWARRSEAVDPADDGSPRSAWYPTIRIFQQRSLGDWSSVVAEIGQALQARQSHLPASAQGQGD